VPSGTVKWFNAARGFGFIVPDGGGDRHCVHIWAVRKSGFNGLGRVLINPRRSQGASRRLQAPRSLERS